ncbi:MAG: DUF3307 domain-containing protein [Bacteroidota bacterium]|nr:DUF3307 domain-containing protein [Bacteroidota bacterium]
MEKAVAVLIAAHFLGDFLFQTDWLVDRKKRLPFMFVHCLIHAVLVYVMYQEWANWQLPVAILFLHMTIDKVKQAWTSDTAASFAWDQAAHILGLIGVGWLFLNMGWQPPFRGFGYVWLIGFAGFIATVRGSGYFIGRVAEWIKKKNSLEIDGLENGGAMIGEMERALIFLLIFIGQPAGIGFLVAAKSILRFEEAKKQKLAEYVLIGTLLSFSLAIAIATATRFVMKL